MKILKAVLICSFLFMLTLLLPACGHKTVQEETTAPEETAAVTDAEGLNREPAEVMAGSYGEGTFSAGTKKRRGVGERKATKKRGKKRRGHGGGGGGGGSGKSAPIWSGFYKNFKACAPDCEPANWGTYGTRGGRCTCHSSGHAIDVGALSCGGKMYPAIKRGRFDTFVSCMKGKMKTLYRNGKDDTLGHRDHAHFSFGCNTKCGRWY